MPRHHPAAILPRLLLPLLVAALLLCAASPTTAAQPPDPIAELLGQLRLQRMGYAIQVGAFAHPDNAVRLERALAARGVDAYYFRHQSGLYKVRFGNHSTYAAARAEASQLRQQGAIDNFFIVEPQDYAVARAGERSADLRAELVATARRFLGVPYRWGGSDRAEGFDCSGLTMVCYRLGGLDLPRVSRSQFEAGRPVPRQELLPGDLVFFATRGGTEVSHVGIYLGGGEFIHAPRTGETVQVQQLSHPFYEKTFLGGRSYL